MDYLWRAFRLVQDIDYRRETGQGVYYSQKKPAQRGGFEVARRKLMKRFGEIYNCRFNAVHNGELGKTVKSGGNQIPTREFIERSQDLCRESIMKVIDDGGFPDWDSLILGANLDE